MAPAPMPVPGLGRRMKSGAKRVAEAGITGVAYTGMKAWQAGKAMNKRFKSRMKKAGYGDRGGMAGLAGKEI